MRKNTWLYWLSLVMTLVIVLFLFCFHSLVVKVPYNYIIIFLFTLFNSYLLSAICRYQPAETVFIAGVLTLGMFTGLTLFAFFVIKFIIIVILDKIRYNLLHWIFGFFEHDINLFSHYDINIPR